MLVSLIGYPYQAILGDFNTLSHSLARFSGKYCQDHLRWKTLGWTEAEWVSSHIFDIYDCDGPQNPVLKQWNVELDSQALIDVRNPFLEEVIPSNTETLTNYRGWFYGKLDWALTRAIAVHSAHIGNNNYSASDHKSILLESFLDEYRYVVFSHQHFSETEINFCELALFI